MDFRFGVMHHHWSGLTPPPGDTCRTSHGDHCYPLDANTTHKEIAVLSGPDRSPTRTTAICKSGESGVNDTLPTAS